MKKESFFFFKKKKKKEENQLKLVEKSYFGETIKKNAIISLIEPITRYISGFFFLF
jgi:hypothetical protein